MNHVVTGYNTVFRDGEMVIAGYELGSGCGPYWIAWLINLFMFAFGLVMCPRDMFRAFLRGRRAKSVYRQDKSALRELTVSELRTALGVPDASPAPRLRDRLMFGVWAVIGTMVAASPVLVVGGLWLALR